MPCPPRQGRRKAAIASPASPAPRRKSHLARPTLAWASNEDRSHWHVLTAAKKGGNLVSLERAQAGPLSADLQPTDHRPAPLPSPTRGPGYRPPAICRQRQIATTRQRREGGARAVGLVVVVAAHSRCSRCSRPVCHPTLGYSTLGVKFNLSGRWQVAAAAAAAAVVQRVQRARAHAVLLDLIGGAPQMTRSPSKVNGGPCGGNLPTLCSTI